MKYLSYSNYSGDHKLFYHHSALGGAIYVNGIIITSIDFDLATVLAQHLSAKFNIKYLGPVCYFLGMKVASPFLGIFV